MRYKDKIENGRHPSTHLLFEIPSVFFVDQNKIEIIARAKLLVDVAKGGRQVEATKEQTYRNCFAYVEKI